MDPQLIQTSEKICTQCFKGTFMGVFFFTMSACIDTFRFIPDSGFWVDFPWKIRFKILNKADYKSFSDFFFTVIQISYNLSIDN